jgi:hypothetical protein
MAMAMSEVWPLGGGEVAVYVESKPLWKELCRNRWFRFMSDYSRCNVVFAWQGVCATKYKESVMRTIADF